MIYQKYTGEVKIKNKGGINLTINKDNLIKKQQEEIERLNSIIKEVREYIKDNAMYSEEEKICCDDLYTSDCDEVLKILDKVGDK